MYPKQWIMVIVMKTMKIEKKIEQIFTLLENNCLTYAFNVL